MKFTPTFLALALLLCGASMRAAELKIAVVDTSRIVPAYYKVAAAEAKDKAEIDKATAEIQPKIDLRKKLEDEVTKLGETIKNKKTPFAEKAKAKDDFDAKLKSLQDLAKEIQEQTQSFKREKGVEANATRKAVAAEIVRTVRAMAKAEGYNLVLEKIELGGTLIYAGPEVTTDITDRVIAELNKDAPKS